MKLLSAFVGIFLCLSANAAGLGFNPFDKSSPTSALPQNSKQISPSANPSQPKSPAIPASPPTRPSSPAPNGASQSAKK